MTRPITILLIAPLLLAACQQAPPPAEPFDQRAAMNTWMIRQYTQDSVNKAIISQHTLQPYHFRPAAAMLNELGDRDLNVLAAHYQTTPGRLNVRRGEADDALYEARVAYVMQALEQAGVDVNRVTVEDDLPGGPGLVSERSLVILGNDVPMQTYPSSGSIDTASPSTQSVTTGTGE